MSLRLAFVAQASQPDATLSALCAQFGISCPTGYKWLARYRAEGISTLWSYFARICPTCASLLYYSHRLPDPALLTSVDLFTRRSRARTGTHQRARHVQSRGWREPR